LLLICLLSLFLFLLDICLPYRDTVRTITNFVCLNNFIGLCIYSRDSSFSTVCNISIISMETYDNAMGGMMTNFDIGYRILHTFCVKDQQFSFDCPGMSVMATVVEPSIHDHRCYQQEISVLSGLNIVGHQIPDFHSFYISIREFDDADGMVGFIGRVNCICYNI